MGRSNTEMLGLAYIEAQKAFRVSGNDPGIPIQYDAKVFTYTGQNITSIAYKTGGISGTTVATVTIAYSGNNPTSWAVVVS